MTPTPIIGIMGSYSATPEVYQLAFHIGELVAQEGWIVLTGGRAAGVMEAAAKGAKTRGGVTIGILPGKTQDETSEYIDFPILTGMGDARNVINILTSWVVVACPGEAGTLSEIALALKNKRPVILLAFHLGTLFEAYHTAGLLYEAHTPEEAITQIKHILTQSSNQPPSINKG